MRFLLTAAAVLSCSSAFVDSAEGQINVENRRVVEFLYDPFDPPLTYSIVLGDAAARVLERFGKPRHEKSTIGSARGDPTEKSEYLTWEYDGMTVEMDGPVGESSRWISRVQLTGSSYKLKFGIRIGATRAEISSALNEKLPPSPVPYLVTSQYSERRTDVPGHDGEQISVLTYDELTIEFDESDKAKRLVWRYYAD